jgi:hypothetical protein
MIDSWALLSLCAFAISALGCFSTSYDLTSQTTSRRQLITAAAPPDRWLATDFDDSGWATTIAPIEKLTATGAGMPTIYVRQRFDLGPDPAAYHKLTMHYGSLDGRVVAYVNGHAMTVGEEGKQVLRIGPGVVRASGNVLALAIHPNGSTVAMDARLDGSESPSGAQIIKGPYLLRPTGDGITVVWETASDTPSRAVVEGVAHDGGSDRLHVAAIAGLQADRLYHYHVETDDSVSEEAQFATAPPAGKRLRFVVFGDNRSDGDVHRQLVEALLGDGPDFVVNTGDMVGESTGSEWQTFFNIEYPLLLGTPLFPVMGNHEHDYGEDETFARLFPLGSAAMFSGRVYSFDYGSVHFAVLDSNGDLGEQSRWLDVDLTGADERGQRSFVAMHWGPVCGCAGFQHGSNDDAAVVLDVATRHRVAGLFSGHNHLYERGVSRGVPYVVTGGGGAPLMSTGVIESTQATFSQNHYVLVDVGPDAIRLTAKTADGAILDDASLGAL